MQGAGAGFTHATAWYFRSVEAAQAFVARFPMLELADGTELPTYQSPYLPFGRGADWSDLVCFVPIKSRDRTLAVGGEVRSWADVRTHERELPAAVRKR